MISLEFLDTQKKLFPGLINNEKSVKSSTREAIQKIIDEYNFKPILTQKI